MPAVLFVCTANQFRSPLAAAFFNRKLQRLDWKGSWKALSAGTRALPGSPALPVAAQVGSQLGVSLLEHRAQEITPALISTQDVILTMEKQHKEALQIEFPLFAKRIFLLTEMSIEAQGEIADPVEHPERNPHLLAIEIEALVESSFYRICAQALKFNYSAGPRLRAERIFYQMDGIRN